MQVTKQYFEQNKESKLLQSPIIQEQLQSDDEIVINMENISHEQIINAIENEIYDKDTYMIYDFLQICPDQILMKMVFNKQKLGFKCKYLDDFDYEYKLYQIDKNEGNQLCYTFIANGYLDMIKYLYENGFQPGKHNHQFYSAIRSNDVNIVKYLHQKLEPHNDEIIMRSCSEAVEIGNFEILKFLRENGFPLNERAYQQAVYSDNLQMTKYLDDSFCPHDKTTICQRVNSVQMLQYLQQQENICDQKTCEQVSYNGHLDVLKYLHENGCPWDYQTCVKAALNDDLKTLKYAHKNGCEINKEVMCSANSIEVLKYLYENNCPWDERVCFFAAENSDLEMLKFAHKRGCPFSGQECGIAAQNHCFEILEYARENGCDWY